MSGDFVAVIGGGAWGTAFAVHLARAGTRVRLWAREPEVVAQIKNSRRNETFLPGVEIPENIIPTNDLNETTDAAVIFWVVPTQFLRSVAERFPRREGAIHIAMSKGIERKRWRFPYQILGEYFGEENVVVLSGPSFAEEVARGLPTVMVAAAKNIDLARQIQEFVSDQRIRVYRNPDPVGVSLGGAYKNVIAVATGISDGLGFGHNTRAALITRGLSELVRLGEHFGAQKETLFGIAGLGDMVLTCTSAKSRNYSFGLRLGQGKTTEQILAESRHIAEGIYTTFGALYYAEKFGIELPIADSVHRIVWKNSPPQEEVVRLMKRPLKQEW
ncbi:MAG TPA: NAD(P)-dependent glycerol-3-phosphate dehydrogenase [candidate division Zixibacteria bacterium]|nr:NAD(P)-dependent glycerol-3-phosphate dehydrogenase [candidate division Zixibacteria bacterium]